MMTRITTIFTVSVICLGLTNAIAAPKEKGGDAGKKGNPSSGVNNFNAGNAAFQQKNYPQAIAEYGRAIDLNPNQPAFYENRAFAYLAMERLDEALTDFNKVIEISPKDEKAYIGRAQIYLKQTVFDSAIADADKAIEINPNEAKLYQIRGFANVGLQQWDKAIADFTNAIQRDANDWQNYDQRALAYRKLKDYQHSVEDYNQAIEKNPNATGGGLGSRAIEYARRGYTYSEMQQYEKAIPDFQEALKLDPNDADTPMRLQYAQSRLAAKNAPPPTPEPSAAPVQEKTNLFTPMNIALGLVVLGIIAAVIRLVTRGKAEPTSNMRIR